MVGVFDESGPKSLRHGLDGIVNEWPTCLLGLFGLLGLFSLFSLFLLEERTFLVTATVLGCTQVTGCVL